MPTPSSRPDGVQIQRHEADELGAEVTGTVFLPGDAGYEGECAAYNLAHPHRPAVVVGAVAAADVQAAVRFAARRRLPVAVLATGHGTPMASDGAVLIATRRMDAVTIDEANRVARVEAGTRWEQVVAAAAPFGLAPLNGASPTVGVVGYTLGGGLGPLGRAYGYASDRVRAIDLVTADGELRQVTPSSEPDLFWALRGGKGNFGVVTAIEFDLVPLPHFYGGGLFFPGEYATQVLNAWREWVATVPDEMTSSVALLRLPPLPEVPEPLRGRLTVHVRIAYAGTAADAEPLVEPLRAAAPSIIDTVAEMPYAAVGSIHADPPAPIPVYDRSALLREFPAEAVDAIVELAGSGADCPLVLVEIRHLGGALARPGGSPSAIDHHQLPFLFYTVAIAGPDQADAVDTYAAKLLQNLAPWDSGRRFVNFLTATDATAEGVRGAYTTATYERLRAVKASYDPENLFRVNQNIEPLPNA
ncbi:FAD-binding oxidoreductase [Micromonospora sp. CA-259024]|uniref:FAD-binding oxidoreductase n=1 Tax=Micromonospora sp. CA-259024 TaxID=3239965 RepID=UPI003D9423A2